MSELTCATFIGRQYIKGKRRIEMRNALSYCTTNNYLTNLFDEQKIDSPLIPTADVVRKIKSEGNEKCMLNAIESIGAKEFSIISLGYNFSVEINIPFRITEYTKLN